MKKFITAVSILFAFQAQAEEPINMLLSGGSYTEAQQAAYIDPWTEESDESYTSMTVGSELAKIRAEQIAGNPTVDVAAMNGNEVIMGCEQGLLEPLDFLDAEDYVEGALLECGVGADVYATVVATRPSKTIISSAEDFFDPSIPGRRGLKRSPTLTLELALMGAGVPQDEIYEVLGTEKGIGLAFETLDRIKDRIVWWEAGAQPPQLLADGEVVATTAYSGRIVNLRKDEGFEDSELLWSTQIMGFTFFAIPANAPHMERARKAVSYFTGPQNAAFADYMPYSPTTTVGEPNLTPDYPTWPANAEVGLVLDDEFWTNHSDALGRRFTAWLAKE